MVIGCRCLGGARVASVARLSIQGSRPSFRIWASGQIVQELLMKAWNIAEFRLSYVAFVVEAVGSAYLEEVPDTASKLCQLRSGSRYEDPLHKKDFQLMNARRIFDS